MKFLRYFTIFYILFSPLLFSGSIKFLHYFLFFTTSILLLINLYKKEISVSFKFPLIFFSVFSFITIFTTIPLNNFFLKLLSPNLYNIVSSFNLKKTFSLSFAPVWTLRNLSFIIIAVSIFLFSFNFFEKQKEKTYKFSRILFFSIFFFSLYSVLLKYSNLNQYPLPPFKPSDWNFGLFPNANIFASYALFGIPIGFSLFLYKIKQKNSTQGSSIFYLFCSILLFFSLILAQSWGAIISLFISINICLFYRKTIGGFVFFLIIVLLFLLIFPNLPPDVKRSMENRFYFYSLGLEIFLKYPIFGTGLGTIPIVCGIYQKPLKDTIVDKIHNDYIELLGTSGIISIFFFFSIGMIIYKNLKFLKDKYVLRCGLLLSSICTLIHSAVDFPMQNFTILSYFSLCLGFLYINHKIQEKNLKILKNIFLFLLFFSIIIQFFHIIGLINVKQRGYSLLFPEESFEAIRNNKEIANNFIKTFPFYAPIWGENARLEEKENNFEEAIKSIERAIILQPTNPKLYPLAAKLYFIQGDQENYQNALSHAFGLSNETTLKLFPLNKEETEKIILKSLKISSKYYGKGASFFYLKSYYNLSNIKSKKAKDVLIEGAEKFKENAEIHFLLANEYFKEGNFKNAEEENSISYNKEKNIRNNLLFAKICFKKGDYECSKNYLYEGIKLIKNDTYTLSYFIEGAFLLKAKSIEDAKEFLKTGFFIKPYPLISFYIGLFEEECKDIISAEEWYKKTISIDDKFENAYQRLYSIYKSQKDLKALEGLKTQAKIKFPKKNWYEE